MSSIILNCAKMDILLQVQTKIDSLYGIYIEMQKPGRYRGDYRI